MLSSPFGAIRSEVYWLFFYVLVSPGSSLLGSRFLPSLWHRAAVIGTAPSWGEVVWFTRGVLETRQLWREAIARIYFPTLSEEATQMKVFQIEGLFYSGGRGQISTRFLDGRHICCWCVCALCVSAVLLLLLLWWVVIYSCMESVVCVTRCVCSTLSTVRLISNHSIGA